MKGSSTIQGIEAVTFDFYNTLVHHGPGNGARGANVMAYLRRHGLESDPWDHQILYDVFEPHGREYSPTFSPAQKERYFIRVTARLFQCLNVRCSADAAASHADSVWELIGPTSLVVFADVRATLELLRARGYRLAVISNWQCGLGHFCEELGLGRSFEEVLSSAEIGWEKPSPEIFHEACRRLGLSGDRVLHVGDTPADDIEGAGRAGIRAVLVCRGELQPTAAVASIRSLTEVPALLGILPLRGTGEILQPPAQ